jgi:hypothetical protein
MNAKALARHYDRLTPEERFRLLLAAGARGDRAEQDRLVRAARTATYSTSDHAPFARAFEEVVTLTYIELVEEAARYRDALAQAHDSELSGGDEEAAEEREAAEEERDAQADAEPAEDQAGELALWEQRLDLALAAGFVLKTKANGWKLFCERLSIPPFAAWVGLPGFDRLQRALALTEKVAFVTKWPSWSRRRSDLPTTARNPSC